MLWLAEPASPGSTSSTGCGDWGSRRGRSSPPTTSVARGTGTAIPAPAATSRRPTTPTASIPPSRASGRGRRSTRRNPRSCATPSTSPTSTTSDATSSSRPASSRPRGTTPRRCGSVRTDRGDEVSCRHLVMASGCLSMPKAADIEGAERFAGEVYFTEQVAARGCRLHRQAGGGHRHRLVGHPVDPAHRRAGRTAHGVPTNPQLLGAGPQRRGAAREARTAGGRS